MGTLLKNEWRRIFRGMNFKAALFFGCGIAVWHFWQNVWCMEMGEWELPQNVYVSWMGASSYRMQSYWYFLIFPLLAVIPFAGTFYDDLKSGYMKNVMLRCSRKTYFMGKGMAVFLSGGMCVTIPLVLNFILTAMFRPLTLPDPYVAIGPLTAELGSELYYIHPMVYTIIYLMFDFFVGGMLALSVSIFCYRANYKFIALLIPYVIFYFLYCLGGILNTSVYSPNYFLIPGMGIEKVDSLILILASSIIVLAIYHWKGKRYEG